MRKKIYIVVDVSGSMNELGKIHIQRNLCRHLFQLSALNPDKYAMIEIVFYKWDKEICELSDFAEIDFLAISASGTANMDTLFEFFTQDVADTRDSCVLLLSDGCFSIPQKWDNLKSHLSERKVSIRTVAVGADADLSKLKKISTNNSVKLAENITAAFDNAIFFDDERQAAPKMLAQLKQDETVNSEEDWDD